MEIESMTDRSSLFEKLSLKLISRPGSLELIERGVLVVESDLKDIIKSGEVTFRRVSSDETDNSGSSPSTKILKHQEALDDVTARRLSLAAQQQRQLVLNQEQTLSQISEKSTPQKQVPNKSCNNSTNNVNQSRMLVTSQVSRFKGLVFHNYCPANSKENQEIREQQQEKFIQLQESRNFATSNNVQSQTGSKENLGYQNKCSRCTQAPDKISSLNDLTVAQLKTECRLRGLTRSGNKSALITTLSPFKEEILAIENACTHIKSHAPFTPHHNSNSKLQMNDRSISLPTEYYENVSQEPSNNLMAPLTLNVACFSGSISNLSFGSYPIMISDSNPSDFQNINSSETFNTNEKSSDIPSQTSEIVTLSHSDLQQQLAMNSSTVCYSTPMEVNSQNSGPLFHQTLNPLLFYKLPAPSGHEPAFIQTNGLEMIQLVQQELLRNIECQSQMSSDQESEINQTTLQHRRCVLVNFLQQLIQKTPAFHNCQQLINDQQKISQWINNCPSFDFQNMSQECMDNGSVNSSQSFLAYLNQQPYTTQSTTDQILEQYGENDLLNLINEVVAEDEMKTNAENQNEIQNNNLALQLEMKPPNSPMQTDSQSYNESKNASKSNISETCRGGDQKRAAWVQKVSPRLYKATSNCNSELPFSAFNFEFSGGSLLSACGSHTSSEGCGSLNSSITDAQILSPGTEKVLFETIFQHTNSSSSVENDIFSSTMNMEDVSNS